MEKILVIEDEPGVRENLAEILALAQYEVVTAIDGVQGVEYARQERPDLIICDVMMPQMDGFEVLETLQADPELAAIPIIFLTALTDLDNLRTGMDLGADDYLTKPFEINDLLSSISSRLRKRQSLTQQIEREKHHVHDLESQAQQQSRAIDEVKKSLAVKDKFVAKLIEKHQSLITTLESTLASLRQDSQLLDHADLFTPLETHIQQQKQLLNEAIALQELLKQPNLELLQQYDLI